MVFSQLFISLEGVKFLSFGLGWAWGFGKENGRGQETKTILDDGPDTGNRLRHVGGGV